MTTETSTLLHLSTAHITKATSEILDAGQKYYSSKHDYGWFIWVDAEPPTDMPADLQACLIFAGKLGCRWIIFDCDVPPISDLPKHEW
ncbi:hypothetical protein ACFLEY_22145 [Bradyrhizobium sp. YCK136]|uniref:DUF5983 family protein n=1 Tax=Bradyrhizobium sp. YCK136 TaxID=3351346 RepID=UPI0037C969DB